MARQQWRRVLLDKSQFCILTADHRVRVCRRRGERYADACVMERLMGWTNHHGLGNHRDQS